MLPIHVGWLEFPRVICQQMGPLVSRMGATVKRCFDVTNALLAASAQLNAVSPVSGLATLEKPSIKWRYKFAEPKNCRMFLTLPDAAQSLIDCILTGDLAAEVHKARELLNVLDASRLSPIVDWLNLCRR
jgi:hypothetical protein